MSSAELARRCFVTRQSLQDVLGGPRTAGLVAVAAQPTAGRARPVTLTPAGRTRLAAADAAVAAVETRMVTGLTRAEHHQLTSLLSDCAENLT